MSNKYLTTSYGGGYSVNTTKYTGVTVSSGASEGTNGYYASFYGVGINQPGTTPADVRNYGKLYGNDGILFDAAGSILNAGTINAKTGIFTDNYSATIHNTGLIIGGFTGILLSKAGGVVYNGASSGGGGQIQGGGSGVDAYGGSVINFSTIEALNTGGEGVTLQNATLINGSGLITSALVMGGDGVVSTAGSVLNFAVVDGDSPPTLYYGEIYGGYGVLMKNGGGVTNGAANSRHALIEGYSGVAATGAAATVTNFGDIEGVGPDSGAGVNLAEGGVVKNGVPTDLAALIEGYGGVASAAAGNLWNYGTVEANGAAAAAVSDAGGSVINGSPGDTTAWLDGAAGALLTAAGTVTNYALITGSALPGVWLQNGGKVVNGLGADRAALIQGLNGVQIDGAAGTIVNAATIIGVGVTSGVLLNKGGAIANGSATNAAALIEGYTGVILDGAGLSANFGIILGLGGPGHEGADLVNARLTNGSAAHSRAVVEGYIGVLASGAATVTNFGTIVGDGGVAVDFKSATADLVVEAGATFVGQVIGDGGTLELGSGTGTLTGLFAGGDIMVSGSMAATAFTNFDTFKIDAPASFTLAGTGGTIATGQTLVLIGTLGGAGTLTLTGGTATFDTGADLTIAKVTESGTAVANFAGTTVTVADAWTQTAGTVSASTGDRVNFTGTGDTFSGTLSGAGTVGFTGGTDTLSRTKITATSVTIDGATVTLSGSLDLTDTVSVISPDVVVAATGASLTGGGTISLSDASTNVIKGASASATLTVVSGRIVGAGQLGDGEMALTNDAGGTIDGYLADALTINLGTNTLTNAGLIESDGTGGLVIDGATANTGTLEAIKGTLAVDGAVSGAGAVKIAGGTADFGSTFTENVTFTTAGGVLKLADATTYTGTITGFAKTNITKLDLTDIAFTGATVSYSGTTTSGTLTVKSGAETAKIKLTGDYLTSTFALSKDASGGTIVTDPPEAVAAPPIATLPLITAMAGFGGASGASHALATEAAHVPAIALAVPGCAIA